MANIIPWKTKARELQQNFCDNLGGCDWNKYKSTEEVYLLQNIGYALFGPPDEEASAANEKTGYSKKLLEEIKSLRHVIKDNDNHNSMKPSEVKLKEAKVKLITSLIKENTTNEKPTRQEQMVQQFNIDEICKMIDSYNYDDLSMNMKLNTHIASAIYCTPISAEMLFNSSSSADFLPKVIEIFDKLCSLNSENDRTLVHCTLVSVVFVVLQAEIKKEIIPYPEPIFRVPNDSDGEEKVRFIDRNLRVYRGWDNYLENNKLQKGTYCYPVSGIYNEDEEGNVQIKFGETPAGKTIQRVLSTGDSVGTYVGMGAGVIGIMSLIPAITVAAPIMAGAALFGVVTGVYGVGRGVGALVDRNKHDQEMGLGNAEARNQYISLAGCSLGIFAMGATAGVAMMAREGQVIGAAGCFVVNALQISSLTVNGVGIATAAVNMHQKYIDGNLTTLDVFQFSSNVLFFSMSAVNFRTAKTIIQETQQTTINDFRANLRSKRHVKGFNKLAKNTRQGLEPLEANAKVIRGINNIDNPDNFVSGVVRINKHHNQGAAKLRFCDTPGTVSVNDAMHVDPSSFANINKADRINILDATKNLDTGLLNRAGFNDIMKNMSFKYGMNFDSNMVILESNVCRAFGETSLREIDKTSGGTHFSSLSNAGLLVVEQVLKNPNVTREILRVAVKHFAKLWEGTLPTDFEIRFEFTCLFIVEQVQIMETAYNAALKAGMNLPQFNQEQFDRDYGIQGDRIKHFMKCFELMYSITQNISEFRTKYEAYRERRGQE